MELNGRQPLLKNMETKLEPFYKVKRSITWHLKMVWLTSLKLRGKKFILKRPQVPAVQLIC